MSDTRIAPTLIAIPLSRRIENALPLLAVPALAVIGLLAIRDPANWLTLTVAGLAMGMMIFAMASGLTLIFGLMDIINFGHGAFVAVGAFIGFSVLKALGAWAGAPDPVLNILAVLMAMLAVMAATAIIGLVFERIIVRPVYGFHLKQILVTMGGMIVAQQLIYVIWGPDALHLARPPSLKGSLLIGDASIEKYRLLAVLIGLVLFIGLQQVLARTRIGLLIRAGVENSDMVQALGYRINRLFVAVFAAGSALAGLGGLMWGLYQETITAHMGGEVTTLVFIVIIIGGMGSVSGCFIGALLVGLLSNYVSYLAPKVALISTIALMVAVLMWRPEGLFPVVKAK